MEIKVYKTVEKLRTAQLVDAEDEKAGTLSVEDGSLTLNVNLPETLRILIGRKPVGTSGG